MRRFICYAPPVPYKDPAVQREYQRKWRQQRHDEYFSDKHCVWCGSVENLQLDHVDRKDKVDHKIWSWSESRRIAELAKCQVLCKPCHDAKSSGEIGVREFISQAKLTETQVLEILGRGNESGVGLAREFGVSKYAISKLRCGVTWKHLSREV
jgi:hypothetical protein